MSKELFTQLLARGLTGYGAEFPATLVHEILGIQYPESASKKVFDDLALRELGAIDYVRNILLGQGKYLESKGDIYRVCLPSENRMYVERYMKSADNKLRRANRLSRNTPQVAQVAPTQDNARMHLRQTSRRSFAGAVAAAA